MTDVSRVYQFLAKQGDWQVKADQNGDGTIIKREFCDFMKENFEWNGEDASAQLDLINAFWKTIDTNQSGKISGTNFKNKNALDKKEMASMENKVKAYEILNSYIDSKHAPSVISDGASWKKSVADSLSAKLEAFIAAGKDIETLEAYLQEISPVIENKTTANCCAQEYIKSELKNIIKGYDYPETGSEDLQNMISAYVQNIANSGTEVTPATIRSTVIKMIDKYLATAGLKEVDEKNDFNLSDYMDTSDSAPLNDLQKAVVKNNIETNLESLKQEADYETNSALYDEAITNYINQVLGEAKNGTFEDVKAYGIEQFKASDIGKGLEKTLLPSEIDSGMPDLKLNVMEVGDSVEETAVPSENNTNNTLKGEECTFNFGTDPFRTTADGYAPSSMGKYYEGLSSGEPADVRIRYRSRGWYKLEKAQEEIQTALTIVPFKEDFVRQMELKGIAFDSIESCFNEAYSYAYEAAMGTIETVYEEDGRAVYRVNTGKALDEFGKVFNSKIAELVNAKNITQTNETSDKTGKNSLEIDLNCLNISVNDIENVGDLYLSDTKIPIVGDKENYEQSALQILRIVLDTFKAKVKSICEEKGLKYSTYEIVSLGDFTNNKMINQGSNGKFSSSGSIVQNALNAGLNGTLDIKTLVDTFLKDLTENFETWQAAQ